MLYLWSWKASSFFYCCLADFQTHWVPADVPAVLLLQAAVSHWLAILADIQIRAHYGLSSLPNSKKKQST
jgi:hypothetical protein